LEREELGKSDIDFSDGPTVVAILFVAAWQLAANKGLPPRENRRAGTAGERHIQTHPLAALKLVSHCWSGMSRGDDAAQSTMDMIGLRQIRARHAAIWGDNAEGRRSGEERMWNCSVMCRVCGKAFTTIESMATQVKTNRSGRVNTVDIARSRDPSMCFHLILHEAVIHQCVFISFTCWTRYGRMLTL
jgi:hypothetical protein